MNGAPFVNPVRGVETVRGEPRTRVLTEEAELGALGCVLAERQGDADSEARKRAEKRHQAIDPAKQVPVLAEIAVARLVALSGWRRGEWSTVQWPEIDWAGHCVRRDTKNGMWTRAVGEPVLEYLKLLAQTRTSSKWVFPNRNGTGGADVKKKIANLFDAAGLTDARSHDLRRTFSTIADDEDYSEATIGMLIGDAPRGIVRKHYIHKPDQALIAAADRISKRIAAALDGKPVAKIDQPPAEFIDLHQHEGRASAA
jgi:integrase